MKKNLLSIVLITVCFVAHAQIVMNMQVPPTGMLYKPQLWNLMVTNTTNSSIQTHIEVTLTQAGNAQLVLTGTTKSFVLTPGTRQLNASLLNPIQYNVIAGSTVSNDPNGLLPLGVYDACFHFFRTTGDLVEPLAEHCLDITIEPLAPPQLVYPFDETAIADYNPQLSWLPPLPLILFTDLKYDLKLVEINSTQSPEDAVQQNPPLYQGNNLTTTSVLYPLNAPGLQLGKNYAWRVLAKNSNNPVSSSETWQFSIKEFGTLNMQSADQPFIKLSKELEGSYGIFIDNLKFEYLNETKDSVWNIRVINLLSNPRKEQSLSLDSIPLLKGQNLVNYNATNDDFFIHKGLYQVELINSRHESWRLRFEYRKTEQPN